MEKCSKNRKEWEILSPKGRFEREQGLIRAMDTKITLFRRNIPKYEITGKSLTSLTNKNVLIIEGDISIVTLERYTGAQKQTRKNKTFTDGVEDLGIYKGDSLHWDILNSKIIIHKYPKNFQMKPFSKTEEYICNIDSGCGPVR